MAIFFLIRTKLDYECLWNVTYPCALRSILVSLEPTSIVTQLVDDS